jgi:DNA-binding CsgD family transcriptional regulator
MQPIHDFFESPADRAAIRRQPLSLHEQAILEALANGAQSKEMAVIIRRSRGTVEFYIRGLFIKLEARSRPHLVAQAFRRGLLSVDGKTMR